MTAAQFRAFSAEHAPDTLAPGVGWTVDECGTSVTVSVYVNTDGA